MTSHAAVQTSATSVSGVLHELGEHLAAGYMEDPDALPVLRFARAIRAHLANVALPEFAGEALYPCSGSLYVTGDAVEWHYSSCLCYYPERVQQRLDCVQDEHLRQALMDLDSQLRDYPRVGGYTHSIPNYWRILTEGLASYRERIARARTAATARGETHRVAFCDAMDLVLDGVEVLHERAVARVRECICAQPGLAESGRRLIAALEQVPFRPARDLYEAFVCVNFVLYVDGPDDLGRFDQDLLPFFQADVEAGRVTEPQVLEWIGQVWRNIDDNSAWNVALGGLLEDGTSGISRFTELCVEAGKGMRRPNLALRLHRSAPDSVWDAAFDSIAAGTGIPALYNEDAYIAAIRDAHLGVSEADLPDFAFGGCTELMVHGKSNVGSLEGDLNLPEVLVQSVHNELLGCGTFDEFLAAFKGDLASRIRTLTDAWDKNQESKAAWQPQVIRSLLIDDCIDNAREYNAGGARYNWCVVNVMGLGNVVDSLSALRHVVFTSDGPVSREFLLDALSADFAGYGDLRRRLEAAPRFGNGDERADELASDVSEFAFAELRKYSPWRGGRYVPACLMFTTYAHYGVPVGATPDGRKAGAPIADSAGAVQGRDRNGPTAMLGSVARVRHCLAPGTLVVNARFSKKHFSDEEGRRRLRDLVETYFALGGMQIQINVVSQDVLRDALAHPERHGDLIIRMGGYSEYWTRLDDALRASVLERTEHL